MGQFETTVLDATPDRQIIKIEFHGGDWANDRAIREVIKVAVVQHSPAAILLDLSEFQYLGGDNARGFLIAFFDEDRKIPRPACFLGADEALKALFNTIDTKNMFGISYFDDYDKALDHLRSRSEPGEAPSDE